MPLPHRGPFIRFLAVIFRGVYRLQGGLKSSGGENIPETGGCILAPNHLSWADPPAIKLNVNRDCWFMANAFLFKLPILGKLIPLVNAFPVKRGVLDREAIREAEKHLKDGDLLCVFPEGGTTVTGRLVPFEGGVALLAMRNNVPIVPVGITGTDRILPSEKPIPRYFKGGVTVTFGPPIYPSDIDPSLPKRERMDLLTQRLYDAVTALLPPTYLPKEGEPRGVASEGNRAVPTNA